MMAAPHCLVTYRGIDGRLTTRQVRDRGEGWAEFYKARRIDPKACLYVQPWMFGDGETKKTGLWLKDLPLLEPDNIVEGRKPVVHNEPPGPDRWKNRSRTYPGIARAMADQWGKEDLG